MKIAGILFDVDGTLVNTWDLYLEAYRLVVQPYVRKPLHAEDIKRSRPSSERQFIQRMIPEKEQDQAYRRLISHYGYFYDELSGGTYAGIHDMLEKVRQSGYPAGIFTGKSRPAWEITNRKEKLGVFNVVVTDSDVEQHKPHPEGLEKAADLLGVAREGLLYVGDSILDYKTAQQAGVQFAAALWAKSPEEKMSFKKEAYHQGVDKFLLQPDELFSIIR